METTLLVTIPDKEIEAVTQLHKSIGTSNLSDVLRTSLQVLRRLQEYRALGRAIIIRDTKTQTEEFFTFGDRK